MNALLREFAVSCVAGTVVVVAYLTGLYLIGGAR